MRTACVGLALTLLAATALAGDSDKEIKALKGKWVGTIEGTEEIELSFDGNKWTFQHNNKKEIFARGTFTVDLKARPAAMDLKIDEGGDKAEKFKGKTALAIYELSGDTLKWCANEPGNTTRPTAFANDMGHLCIEFKRVK